jgi:hypothetical protein
MVVPSMPTMPPHPHVTTVQGLFALGAGFALAFVIAMFEGWLDKRRARKRR